MDYKLATWTIFLFAVVAIWFAANLHVEIDYDRHSHLIDPVTGTKRKPSDFLDMKNSILQPPEYINSTNAQERLYDLIYNLDFENPFVISSRYTTQQDLVRSGWPVANEKKCGKQVDWILNKLNTHKNYTFLKGRLGYELSTLMDTYGRPESGLYGGSIYWMGSYDRCMKLTLDGGSIKTRYCIARMRPKWWPKNEVMSAPISIKIGFCIPETCDTQSFQQFNSTIETLVKFELPEPYKDGLNMESMFCLPDERSPVRRLPLSGWIYIQVVGFWLTIVLAATTIHVLHYNKKNLNRISLELNKEQQLNKLESGLDNCNNKTSGLWEQIVSALSLRTSIKEFKSNAFRIKYHEGERVRVHLGCLDFLKVLMSLTIILAHSSYLAMIYMRSLSMKVDLCTGELARMSLSISRCVETYFVFFGVLTTYSLMRKCNIKQLSSPITWLAVNIGICLKIVPLFMIVYWYSRSVSPYTGAGPWWDYGVDKYSLKGVCMRDPWWKSIPYFGSSGRPPVPTCNPPSWFIVSYSQISLLLPLITYILCKLPRNVYRYLLVITLTSISALSVGIRMYRQTSFKEEAFTLYGAFLTSLLEKFESTGHMLTLARLGSVTVCCLVGYLLRKYELGEIDQWPKWLRSKITIILTAIAHLVIIFLPIIGHRFYLKTGKLITTEQFVGFNALLMTLYPILNSIMILNFTTVNNHRVLIRFCSHAFWHAFNKLGLLIYLVHWEIVFIGLTNFEQAPSYGFVTDVMKSWSFGIFVSIVVAFTIHIVIEQPFTRIVMLVAAPFLKPGNPSKREGEPTAT